MTVYLDPTLPLEQQVDRLTTVEHEDGSTTTGVTEVNADGAVIIRFEDGRWAYAQVSWMPEQVTCSDLPVDVTCDGESHWTSHFDQADPGETGELGQCPLATAYLASQS